MAIYNGNDDYLSIDGVNFSAVRRQIDFNPSVATTDVSAGSGITWTENAEGLNSIEMTMFIGYPTDAATRAAVLTAVAPGTKRVIYGPEGNAAGKPKFECDMIFKGAPSSANHDKSAARGFNVSAMNAAAPIANLATDTF